MIELNRIGRTVWFGFAIAAVSLFATGCQQSASPPEPVDSRQTLTTPPTKIDTSQLDATLLNQTPEPAWWDEDVDSVADDVATKNVAAADVTRRPTTIQANDAWIDEPTASPSRDTNWLNAEPATTSETVDVGDPAPDLAVEDVSDTDQDALPDRWEERFGLIVGERDTLADPDRDGLNNLAEWLNGAIPDNPDSDSDGMPDGWEVDQHFDPTDFNDAIADSDGDGYSNFSEYQADTDPHDAKSP